jgi:hypothetical protein
MTEIWKDIKGFEGIYKISNLGNVKSFKYNKTRLLKKLPNTDGYFMVVLCKKGIQKRLQIHRLVCETFIPNIENKPQVNHINGIITDNKTENLEWCTASENQIHAYKILKKSVKNGSKNGMAKLTEDQVKKIKYSHLGLYQRDIAKIYKVSDATISDIKRGRIWKHV